MCSDITPLRSRNIRCEGEGHRRPGAGEHSGDEEPHKTVSETMDVTVAAHVALQEAMSEMASLVARTAMPRHVSNATAQWGARITLDHHS